MIQTRGRLFLPKKKKFKPRPKQQFQPLRVGTLLVHKQNKSMWIIEKITIEENIYFEYRARRINNKHYDRKYINIDSAQYQYDIYI